jgi:23S rRNA pseudouridine1911/1915/1917 synthase
MHYLVKDRASNTVRTAAKSEPGALEALLEYETAGAERSLSLVRIRLHTGRPHQIRVQMAAVGCPLYGDGKYGAPSGRSGRPLALWSAALGFEHPTTKEALLFRSAPPRSHPWNLWPEPAYGE